MPTMSLLGAALTAAGLLALPPGAASTPLGAAPPGAAPVAAAAPAATTVAAARLDTAGLAVLANNTITRADGRVIRLALPRGVTAMSAAQVPSGWLVGTAEANRTGALWFAGHTGAPRRIGPVRGNWAVSSNGGLLVVTGLGAASATNIVTAINLPTLSVRATTRFAGATGPLVVGITTDRVVLRQAQGSPGPSIAAVWNLRTGALRPTTTPIWVWSAGDGQAVTRVDQAGPRGGQPSGACVDAVAVTDRLPVGRTGLCTSLALQIQYGGIAPGGGWAVVITAAARRATTSLVRVRDLQVGRWRPVSLGGQRLPLFWDTPTTLIVVAPRGNAIGYQRCDTHARCAALTLPRVAAGSIPPSLVPRFGS